MSIFAIVVNLTGRAWAVAMDGQRRELQVGDQLRGDEMLLTEAGARIDLDFGNNQQLTFLGEQQHSIATAALAISEPLSRTTPISQPTQAPASSGTAAPKTEDEGHNFVQLVRIGELIEADGITPLTVARIQELLRPLGMSLPERVYDLDEWREQRGDGQRYEPEPAIRAPDLTVALQGAGADGRYNAAEIGPDGTVPALITPGSNIKVGDILKVTDKNGTVLLERPMTQDDIDNGVIVQVPVTPGDTEVSVTATITDSAGNIGSSTDSKRTDGLPPVSSPIVDQSAHDSDSVHLDISSYFNDVVSGKNLTYVATGLPDGLTIDPATGVISGTIDHSASQRDSDGDGQPDGKYSVTITVTDEAGNNTDTTFSWAVTNPIPTANNDTGSGAEDSTLTGNVLNNDSDPDGDTLTVTEFVVNGTTYPVSSTTPGSAILANIGTLTINANGSYSFIPVANWNGAVPTVTYTVSDGEGGTDTATLILTVTPVNDAPETVGSIANQSSEDAETGINLNVTGYFTDVDGDTLVYSATGLPAGLSIDPATGIISGTIDNSASQDGSYGVHSVTITAKDGNGGTVTQTFNWTVTNPAPTANDDSVSTLEDTAISGNVLTDTSNGHNADTDPDGDALRVVRFTVEGNTYAAGSTVLITGGTLTLNANGSYTFTPLPDWNGTVPAIAYDITDDEGGADSATLAITVTPENDAPEAVGTITDRVNLDADSGINLNVSGNFRDVDGLVTYSATGLPDGLSIDATTGVISGTINHSASQGGNNGLHTVIVTATDGSNATATQTFSWTVKNPAPIANNDTGSGAEDSSITGNVLNNDRDPDGDTLTVTEFVVNGTTYPVNTTTPGSVTLTNIGTLTINADGAYSFIPVANWNGTVPTVTYTISDGEGGIDTATLILTVTPVNDAPETVGSIANQSNEDADSGISLNITGYFTDVDGDTLTYSATGLPAGLTIDPTTGIISGTIDRSASQGGTGGVHAVTITATDGDGASTTQTFNWAVTNPAPTANNDTGSGAEDSTLTGNVLTNDSDPDGDTLTVTEFVVNGTTYPVSTTTPGSAILANIGTLTLNANGSYSFIPAANWNGTVPTVTYTVSDGEGSTDTATLILTVTPVNDAPETVGRIANQSSEDADSGISLNVAGYFTDVDGDTLTYSATGLPAGLTIDPVTGIISGTIDNSASQDGTGGVHAVTIIANDGKGGTVTQSFDWTVTNPAPTANDDSVSALEDTAISGNVLTDTSNGHNADTDPDGDALRVVRFTVEGKTYAAGSTAIITGGLLKLNGDGSYSFTPDADWHGVVAPVTYVISDDEGGADTAVLSITVTPVNDIPTAVGSVDNQSNKDADTITVLDVRSYFADIDGDTLTYSASGLPDGLSIDPTTGIISGTIDKSASQNGSNGVHSVTITANDGNGGTVTQTFNWTVTNPAPTANNDTGSTNEESVLTVNAANGVLNNDTDPDGDLLVVAEVNGALAGIGQPVAGSNGGLFTLNADGSYRFDPNGEFENLADGDTRNTSITYTVSDSEGGTASATLTVTVTGTNDAPVLVADANSVKESGVLDGGNVAETGTAQVGGNVLTNDTDVDGDTLTVTNIAHGTDDDTVAAGTATAIQGTYGTLTINANGSYSYALNNTAAATQALASGQSETEVFTYTVSDGTTTGTQTLTITVEGTNDAPVIAGGPVTRTLMETNAALTESGSFTLSDVDLNDDVTASVTQVMVSGDGAVGAPSNADLLAMLSVAPGNILSGNTRSAALDWDFNSNGEAFNYLRAGQTLTLTYTVQAKDGKDATDTETVTITITGTNDTPVIAGSTTGAVTEDISSPLLTTTGTLTVTDPDAGESAFQSGTAQPVGTVLGNLVITESGSWTYQVNNALVQYLKEGETRDEVFTVRTADGTEQQITVTITGVNDAPVITGGPAVAALAETNAALSTSGSFTVTDVDVADSVTASVTGVTISGSSSAWAQTPSNADLLAMLNITPAAVIGVGDTSGNLGWSFNSGAQTFDYLNAGETLVLTYIVQVQDGEGATDTETVTLTITGTNDVPVVSNGAGSVTEDNPADITAGNLTTGGTLTITDLDRGEAEFNPATLVFTGTTAAGGTQLGTLTVDENGAWTFSVPNNALAVQQLGATESIVQTWTVKSADGTATSDITVTINGSNDAPTISGAASGNVAEDGVQTATGQLNKADVDIGDTHTWSVNGSSGTYGTLTVDPTGKWNYVLDNAAAQAIPAGQTVQDTITVRVTDAAGAFAEQSVIITITGENDAPVILGSSTLTGAVTELADNHVSENNHTHEATGKIDFSDVDTLVSPDNHSVQSITPQGAGYLGSLALGAVDQNGHSVDWTFTVTDSALDQLAQGQTLTQKYDVTISDGKGGTAVTTVTITLTGTNDAPVINTATSTVTATVTEITDGAAGENTFTHGHQGYVYFSDVDTQDTVHTVAVTPVGTGYIGDFTWTPVDNVNDRVGWQFTVPDSVLDSLPAGSTLTQEYRLTITDEHGDQAEQIVTITINGTNDRPEVVDDLSLTVAELPITKDVLANDSDVDNGDEDRWTITHIGSQPISVGNPVTLPGQGKVQLNANGTLTLTPEPGFSGQIILPYTVNDGSGATDATATANWTINVIGVKIVDDKSPAGVNSGNGDNVLASIDTLTAVQISGHVPVGGTLESLIISSAGGGTPVELTLAQIAAITINPDGSFTTSADLSGLPDGILTVSMGVKDSDGNTGSTTDTILKDTVTPVAINPLLVVDGEIPTITGTGEPGATIELSIDGGTPVTVAVQSNGNWTYTPANPLANTEITLEVLATDIYGNTNTADRKIVALTIEDKEPSDTAHVMVYEAALADGSSPALTTEAAQSTFTLGTTEGVNHIIIGGNIVGGAINGGTTITLVQLQNVGTTPIAAINTTYGTLAITDYNAATGEVSYTYAISDNTTAHSSASDNDILRENIQLAVVDTNGDTRVGTLTAAVVDDVAAAVDDAAVTLAEGSVTVSYINGTSTGGATNLLANDTLGADGARVHQVTYTNTSGASATSAAIVDGSSVTVSTQYGSLTVHSNGDWSYTSNGTVQHGSAASVSDNFSYTLIDGDGDISASATQPITVTDTAPQLGTIANATVDEDDLPLGSDTSKESLTVTGSLGVTKGADPIDTKLTTSSAPTGLKSGGVDVEYELSADGHTLTAYKGTGRDGTDRVFVLTVTNPDGSSTPGYSFTLHGTLDHVTGAGENTLDLSFGFEAKETEVADGDLVNGNFTITVTDDVPGAAHDTATVTSGSYTAVSGNVITDVGAGKDTVGADGVIVVGVATGTQTGALSGSVGGTGIAGTYGTLVLNDDGSYSYTRNAGGTLGGVNDVFSYTIRDADGDWSTATLTVTINNAVPTVTSAGVTLREENLVDGSVAGTSGPATLTQTGSFTFTSGDGVQSLTVAGQSVTGVVAATDTTHVTITTPLGNTLVITGYSFNPATGAGTVNYSYTLNDNETHSTQGKDNLTESFAIVVTDRDGETTGTAANLVVTVVDDIPVFNNPTVTVGNLSLTVDETYLTVDATTSFAGLFTVNYGADGAATVNALTYALSVDTATASGLVDTATNSVVVFSVNGDGTVITGTADGQTVLVITLDSATGEITLDQQRAVRHASGGAAHDDEVSIATGAISITATAIDGDNDTVTSSINIGDRFIFKDDGPSIAVNTTNLGSIQLDETNLTGESHTVTVSNFATGVFTPAYGADGAAASNALQYSLAVSSAGVDSGLDDVASGQNILLRMNGTTLEGYTATGNALAFTVTVNAGTGALTLTQFRPIKHDDTTDPDDVASILASAIQLRATATDRDGDTTMQSVNIGDQISFKDDGPSIELGRVDRSQITLETTDPGSGSTSVDTVALAPIFSTAARYGTDGAGSITVGNYALELGASAASNSLTSSGVSIVFTKADNDIVGHAGANEVLRFSVAADGTLTVTQSRPIDHAVGSDEQSWPTGLVVLRADITVTDRDGDSLTQTHRIDLGDGDYTIHDTTPTVTMDGDFTGDLTVDESALSISNPVSASAQFAGAFAADLGPDGGTVVFTYSLALSVSGVASGLVDTATGQNIVLTLVGNNEVQGLTTDGDLAFTLAVDTSSGEVTLTQHRAIKHPTTTNHDELTTLATGVLNLIATATDYDGDEESAELDLSGQIGFHDDGPAVTDLSGATQATEGGAAISGSWSTTVGQDDDSARGSDATAATLVRYNGTDYALGASIATALGTLVVNTDGTWNFTPGTNYDHSGADPTITFTLVQRDGDGDTATADHTITVIDGVNPSSGETLSLSLTDVDTRGLATDSASGTLTFTAGSDNIVGFTFGAVSGISISGLDATLTWTGVGTDTLTGSIGGTDVLRVTVSGGPINAATTGDATVNVTQLHELPHGMGLDSLTINGIVVVGTDSDGDTANATVNLTVADDVPTIGTPTNSTLDEANLSTGTDPEPADLTKTGNLAVTISADVTDTVFTTATTDALNGLNLLSGGVSLSYVLSNNGHTLTATAGSTTVFTVNITDPSSNNAGYNFVLSAPLDHGVDGSKILTFPFSAIDADQDQADSSFTITVVDDPQLVEVTADVDEEGNVLILTSANTTGNTVYTQGSHGSVLIDSVTGHFTYTPNTNFSGTDSFTYTRPGDLDPITVRITVKPIADAPTLEADKSLVTDEDVSIALGLKLPTIVDNTDQNAGAAGDHPERLGAITLTLTDSSATGAVFTLADGTELTATGNAIRVVIVNTAGGTDVDTSLHLSSGLPAQDGNVHYLTKTQYEGIQVKPAEHRHENLAVEVSVTSYEVNDSGDRSGEWTTGENFADLPGQTSTQIITVDVQAVTDPVELVFDAGITPPAGVVVDAGGKSASVTLGEDTQYNLATILKATFTDNDGSENSNIVITNNSGATIKVNGADLAAGASTTITANNLSGTSPSWPTINIGGATDFSGSLDNISVKLVGKDTDSDSTVTTGTSDSEVILTLHVNPVAGDTAVEGVTGTEDSAIRFLEGITVTDTSTGTSGEIITIVEFTVPVDWTVSGDGTSWTSTSGTDSWTISIPTGASVAVSGNTYTITTTPAGGNLKPLLDLFTATPPAHSSKDLTLTDVKVTSVDSNLVDDSTVTSAPVTSSGTDLKIEVTPVAERIQDENDTGLVDTDGDGTADLVMNGDHPYTTPGEEDKWYALGANLIDAKGDGWDGLSLWTNQDSNEQTYARLTPELTAGDGSQATANGSQFRWLEGGQWKTVDYTGTPIDVPVESLDSLQFMGPAHFSGQFSIKVQAYTVDYDDDHAGDESKADTKLSGEATLTNVLIKPVADEVTLALNGRATGKEDEPIALNIRPTSSDPSETFNITISDIPVGAQLIYNGTVIYGINDVGGSVTINDFKQHLPLTITPPLHSNVDFTLRVQAQSVDKMTVDGTEHSDTKDSAILPIHVAVQGVADPAPITPTPDIDYSEADLDSGATTVALKDLLTATKTDNDGSETLTLRVSGLPEGFAPSVGTLLTPTATGAARTWVLTQAQFDSATIKVPANYSGAVTFQVASVTTENDGNSLTGTPVDVSFTVTPSPEATMTTGVTVEEDVLTPLELNIVYQNGDTDETLAQVRIAESELVGKNFTLYLDSAGTQPVTDLIPVDGFYVLTPADVAGLYVRGSEHLDGSLGSFNFQYQITDAHYGTVAAGNSVTSDWQNDTFTITATPVTDQPTVTITDITSTSPDGDPADLAVSLTNAGTVTVNLNIASPDEDGSEHLIRVVIDGVPDGVTVVGAEFITGNQWLLVYDGAAAKDIGTAGVSLPVDFVVSPQAGGVTDQNITLTVQVQDRGNQPAPGTLIEEDSISWQLYTSFSGGPGETPAVIKKWGYNGEPATEDTRFTLDDMFDAEVEVYSSAPNTFTITLEDVPAGTTVSGMKSTTINGKTVWTASVTLPADSDTTAATAAANLALKNLMQGISITPSEHSNSNNNTADPLSFKATLTATVVGGSDSEAANDTPTIPVTPVTDNASFAISTTDPELNESDTEIPITLTVSNLADGAAGSIVGGNLYLQISADQAGLQGGSLTVDNTTYTLQSVSGVTGIPDGDYYVIAGVDMGDTLSLVYTPTNMTAGNVTVEAWVRNDEPNGGEITSKGTAIIPVAISNDGVEITSAPVTGVEAADSSTDSLIQLNLGLTLNDTDGSEEIIAILLANLPDGFLVYTGTSASDASQAEMADNAGGAGTNTWVISDENGNLPQYIGILPPQYWSGTLNDLSLLVESGEKSLSEKRVDSAPLAAVTINPVANGITLTATTTFGSENEIIPLNLNSSMADMIDATVSFGGTVIAQDTSQETTTLQLTGLGDHASFYIGTTQIHGTSGSHSVSYDAVSDTWTITGLTQNDLDGLGFKQARAAMTDQDTGASGVQIGVTAWTVDGTSVSASVSTTITTSISAQLSTSGNDTLIWTGNSINGRGGDDTIQLRFGEDLDGSTLAQNLKNIEVLDLSIGGANSITNLTAKDVLDMTDNRNTLRINGTAEDEVTLAAWDPDAAVVGDEVAWSAGSTVGDYTVYTATIDTQIVTLEVQTLIE